MKGFVQNFKFGKLAFAVLAVYAISFIVDMALLRHTIMENFVAGPKIASIVIPKIATWGSFNFFIGSIFGYLVGMYLCQNRKKFMGSRGQEEANE